MPPNAAATGSLMLMAPAGWAIDRAIAAVPPSRIADRRAIAPQRLADDADGRHAPASQLGLARIFRPLVSRSPAPGRRPLNRNHLENTNASPGVGGTHLRRPRIILIVAQSTHPRGVDLGSGPSAAT